MAAKKKAAPRRRPRGDIDEQAGGSGQRTRLTASQYNSAAASGRSMARTMGDIISSATYARAGRNASPSIQIPRTASTPNVRVASIPYSGGPSNVPSGRPTIRFGGGGLKDSVL